MFKRKENIFHLFYFQVKTRILNSEIPGFYCVCLKFFFYTILRKDWKGRNGDHRGENEGGENKRLSVFEIEQKKIKLDVHKLRGLPKTREG